MWALIGGLAAVVIGIILMAVGWWEYTRQFIAGGIVFLLVLGGLVAVASGISDIKDRIAEKKEEEKEKEKEGETGKSAAAGEQEKKAD